MKEGKKKKGEGKGNGEKKKEKSRLKGVDIVCASSMFSNVANILTRAVDMNLLLLPPSLVFMIPLVRMD